MVELAVAPSFGAWDRSRHSPNLDEAFACSPSPRGRGRGEGEGFVRFSIASSILQVALIPSKIAKNLPVFERSFITNDLQNEFLRRGKAHWPRWDESLISEGSAALESLSLSPGA